MLVNITKEAQNHESTQPILQARGLAKLYGTKDTGIWALNHIDFEVYPGEFLGIMGPSGSGKTTLLNLLSTIDKATEGSIQVGGESYAQMRKRDTVTFRNERLGFLFQEFFKDQLRLLEKVYI